MKKVMLTGAGGAPSINFTLSLRDSGERIYIVGTDCDKYRIQRAQTDERHLVPLANDKAYIPFIRSLIEETKCDFLHCQNHQEVYVVSKQRNKLPISTFLPKHRTVEICNNKMKSYLRWSASGLTVPKTCMIRTEKDLKNAFEELGSTLWLREVQGSAGKGSIKTSRFDVAKNWIDFHRGWGKFTAAEYLTPNSTTWLSIWNEGELIVAQGRKRLYWEFSSRSPSGVTGLTGAGMTVSDPELDKIAQESIFAIDSSPHGIFGADLTYDKDGVPNPTEINTGRFFTTHYFFTKAGLNMPHILVKLAYGESINVKKRVNPLPSGLCWIRGMDTSPVLTTTSVLEKHEKSFLQRLKRICANDKTLSAK